MAIKVMTILPWRAENGAHQEAQTSFDAILGCVNAPKAADEKGQKRPQANGKNRTGAEAAQGRGLKFLFVGQTVNPRIAAHDAK